MQTQFIGREEEQQILKNAFESKEAEMVAVIGRRRVGKTFLIKKTYQKHLTFEITGLQNAKKELQLQHFGLTLMRYSEAETPIQPKNWLEAFFQLTRFLDQKPKEQRQVVFFDELPWLASGRTDFLTGLEYFWNSWAVNQNIVVVVCGSAASWMIQKVVNNTGGLYNRITKRIYLKPFNLAETKAYLQNRNIHFNNLQIAELYMAMGGIPHYLKEVESGKSVVQNIDKICFAKSGLLCDEFDQLYPSLFSDADRHIAVIRALGTTQQGLSRTNLLKISKLPEGGNTSKVLEELEQSGFISTYYPFGKKKKGKIFRLTDEYSLFFLRFIENNIKERSGTWHHLSQTQAYKIWSGYAFENICLKHIPQIKKALSIAGIYSQSSTFYKKATATEKGTQIDLLIDRNDKVINLFEIKFHNTEIKLTESSSSNIREKMRIFQESTKTKKYLMMSIITALGLRHNKHSLGLIENVIVLDDLFQ